MKLIIVRHAEPDYEKDSLTEKGRIEAALLAKRMKQINPDFVYASPLGRAQETCRASREACGFEFETLDWLREFNVYAYSPTEKRPAYIWDLMPSYFVQHDLLYDSERWREDPHFFGSDLEPKYAAVKIGLEALLKKHGYVKDGKLFRAVRSNRDTVVLYCHFGVECVILSLLTGFSPYVFFQHFCALTSSVTTIATEEREEGIVSFRCIGFGDLSHLAVGKEEPSFAARFCETYDSEERH